MAVLVTAFLFNLFTLISSQCNYVRNEEVELGYAQPIGICIADKTNAISVKYVCSTNGDEVTRMRWLNDATCDESITFDTTIYTSSNSQFECNGNNDCDICVRT
eukprot:405198_1